VKMKAATSGRRTDLFIGTLSTLSRGNDLQPVPNDELTTTKLRRRFHHATNVECALLGPPRNAQTDDGQACSSDRTNTNSRLDC
jgi:hypothetical protein